MPIAAMTEDTNRSPPKNPLHKYPGKFITLEGMDGAGKSTHGQTLSEILRQRGINVLNTREPGGTPLGEFLRKILLKCDMCAESEALLMFSARQEHILKVIQPALNEGTWVISDRFSDASFAYQGGGRGLDFKRLEVLEDWVLQGLQPDLTLLFNLPVAIAQNRMQLSGRNPDRFEQQHHDFFERVHLAYLRRAELAPERFKCIDASLSMVELKLQMQQICLQLLDQGQRIL